MNHQAPQLSVTPPSSIPHPSIYSRLGHLRRDLAVGDWEAWNDLVNYSYVSHPDQDEKHCSRELLRILGKRFPNAEAGAMWHEIEEYQRYFVERYGPPEGAVGRPDFERAAREWYEIYGRGFEKSWCLNSQLELHFARIGVERVRGRWVRLLHAELLPFVEAGFSWREVLYALRDRRWDGWKGALRRWWAADEKEMVRLWTGLAARLMRFHLDQAGLEQALKEITLHSARLSHAQGYPVTPARASLDYFRRLELAGLRD